MKTILKPGKIKPQYKNIYKTVCPNCDCEYEFEDSDLGFLNSVSNGVWGLPTIECLFVTTQI